MFLDFWIRGLEPGDLLDRRAIAETELADFVATLQGGELVPIVHLQADVDWLAPSTPREWIADMLHTISRYPQCRYHVFSMDIAFWQMRMKPVAALATPGGRIARAWLDGIPPAGLRLGAPTPQERLVSAIAQVRFDPGARVPIVALDSKRKSSSSPPVA